MDISIDEKLPTDDGGFIAFCKDGFVRVSCANRNGEGVIGAVIHYQLVQDLLAERVSNKKGGW